MKKKLKSIINEGKPINIDWEKHYQEKKEREELYRMEREKAAKREQERVENMECPVCKSTKKEKVVKSENNGIFGPGYSSRITEEYLVCKSCGVMYKDLQKSQCDV
jgi:uncharacterized protein YbaR (Trm112 family)